MTDARPRGGPEARAAEAGGSPRAGAGPPPQPDQGPGPPVAGPLALARPTGATGRSGPESHPTRSEDGLHGPFARVRSGARGGAARGRRARAGQGHGAGEPGMPWGPRMAGGPAGPA